MVALSKLRLMQQTIFLALASLSGDCAQGRDPERSCSSRAPRCRPAPPGFGAPADESAKTARLRKIGAGQQTPQADEPAMTARRTWPTAEPEIIEQVRDPNPTVALRRPCHRDDSPSQARPVADVIRGQAGERLFVGNKPATHRTSEQISCRHGLAQWSLSGCDHVAAAAGGVGRQPCEYPHLKAGLPRAGSVKPVGIEAG
jgi:hypothetical protein